jgi:F0F1-type ATP synthase assembly protein I
MSRWWLVVVLIAAVLRELIVRSGYSWLTGTVIALLPLLGFFVFMHRRSPER